MASIFLQSKELSDILSSHGWAAVDVTRPTGVRAEWHEINQTPLAKQFEFGHIYLLVPQPRAGQTIEQAYKTTRGVPAILVENHRDPRFETTRIDEGLLRAGRPVPFTRLLFYESDGIQCVSATSPSTELKDRLSMRLSMAQPNVIMDAAAQARYDAWLMQPDGVAIKTQHVLEIFRNCFRIAQPEVYFVSAGSF